MESPKTDKALGNYTVEYAKSGRAACKKCKEKIEQGALRIGKEATIHDHAVMAWYCDKCPPCPKDWKLDDFLAELADKFCAPGVQLTEEMIDGIISFVETKAGAAKEAKQDKKRQLDALIDAASPKKSKGEPTKDKDSSDMTGADLEAEATKLGFTVPFLMSYLKYAKMPNDRMKDYLRWNGATMSGNKSELLLKCTDGDCYGALPKCPMLDCGGRLSYENILERTTIKCGGSYNEDAGSRVVCFFTSTFDQIQELRLPWRTAPPTDEEAKAMKEGKQAIKTEDMASYDSLFDGLDLSITADKRAAADRLVAAARDMGVLLPEDDSQARSKMGSLLMAYKTSSPPEILNLAAKDYGTKAKTAASSAATATSAKNPGNVGIIEMLQELAGLYKKESNINAATTYNKAAAALRGLDFHVTSGTMLNGKKGNVKVPGVGPKVCTYIDEFLTSGTGTIEKIQEKKKGLGLA
jgi:hypothetical protein